MDSICAEYYRPLWEEYHIFGYHCGAADGSGKEEGIAEKLKEYMSYTLDPNLGLKKEGEKGLELYGISIDSLSVGTLTGLMDYQGGLFLKEAVEYMKYKEVADGIALLLDKLSLLETPKKVSVIYKEKLAAEQELAKADKSILKLMKLLDGVKTSKTGIKLDRNGRLQTEESFVKMLCPETVSMASAAINHHAVFEAVKERYVSAPDIGGQIKQELAELISNQEEMIHISDEIDGASEALEEAKAQLAVQKTLEKEEDKETDPGEMDAPDQNNPQHLQDRVTAIEEQLSRLYGREGELRQEKQERISSVKDRLNNIKRLAGSIHPIIREAQEEINGIQPVIERGSALMRSFEERLAAEGSSLDTAFYESLQKSLEEMQHYISQQEGRKGISEMGPVLEKNYDCLTQARDTADQMLGCLTREDYSGAIYEADILLDGLKDYDIKSLCLDYSTLTLDQSGRENPAEQVFGQIKNGITGLVIEADKISEKKLTGLQLPSAEAALQTENQDFESMINGFFRAAIEGALGKEMEGLFDGFGNEARTEELIGESLDGLAKHLLFREYLREHFTCYRPEQNLRHTEKPSALNYEMEYLLIGEQSDRENLTAVLLKIIFFRMMLDFVTLLGDRAGCDEAKLAATAMVGFTGMPMLIHITQAILLLVWSFAEALADVCALLQGKEVPVLKERLTLKLPEIFLISHSYLKTKAAAYTETGRLSLSYEDYLRGYLMLKGGEEIIYRSMDLIQENLNLRYEESFHMRDCLFGLEAEAKYSIASRFLALPMVSRYLNKEITGYTFFEKASCSY